MPRTICAKRFSVLSQTIFQSTENDFQICRHPLYELYRAEHQIKRRCGCFPESILRFSTSHKRFFTRKGSLPSDLFCTNTLRWTFYRTILHRDFTGKWYTAYRFQFTNVNHLVINGVMVKGLTKAFSCRIFANEKTPKTQSLWTSRKSRMPPSAGGMKSDMRTKQRIPFVPSCRKPETP